MISSADFAVTPIEAAVADAPRAHQPVDPKLLAEAAASAVAGGDLVKALEVCDMLLDAHPAYADGYVIKARTLRDMRRIDDAERFVNTAPAEMAQRIELRDVLIWCAVFRSDWQQAWERSAESIDAAPLWSEGYVHGARSLMRLGRAEEAEELILRGYRLSPEHPGILLEWARSATLRRDWPESLRRWDAAKSLFPDFPEIREGAGEAKMLASLESIAHAATTTSSASTPSSTLLKEAASVDPGVLSAFESLGDNCEFGIVQRVAGAEPLGLLRWATIYPQNLLECLRNQFDGVGDPKNTAVVPRLGEWSIVDTRYFSMHSFVSTNQVGAEKFRLQMARRLSLLRRKLIEDLTTAEKIFVYKTSDGHLDVDMMMQIFEAIQSYGGARLLCVRKPGHAQEDLTVKLLRNGLVVGYLSRMSINPLHARSYFKDWLEICRKAAFLLEGTPVVEGKGS